MRTEECPVCKCNSLLRITVKSDGSGFPGKTISRFYACQICDYETLPEVRENEN